MVPVASAITSLFLDDVADAVEAKHYPTISQQPRTPFGEALRDTFAFLGVIIVVNLLALILYVKWSGKTGQRAKMYPTLKTGYTNDQETQLFRQI